MRDLLKKPMCAAGIAAALTFCLALPTLAGEPAAEAPEASSAQEARAAHRAESAEQGEKGERDNEEKSSRQLEQYLRSVPAHRGPGGLEEDMVKMRSARNWYLLTYPTGTLPPNPYGNAREHVRRNVDNAPAWEGPGIDLRLGGGRGLTTRASVAPNTNTWTAVGPMPLDSVGTTNGAYTYGTVAGRVGAEGLAVDPNNPNVGYAGFVAGGLWKTTNLTAQNPTWVPLWDDNLFITQGVTSVTIDPNDSNTIYVGTGDWAAADQFSSGIMKSTDGGATWSILGADIFTPFSQVLPAVTGNRWSNQNVKTIAVDPNNSNTLLVGTRYDLYVSNDAGASWEICGFGPNYTDPDPNTPMTTVNRVSDIYLDARGAVTQAYVAIGWLTTQYNGNNGVYRFDVPASGCPAWPSDFTTLHAGLPANTGNGVNGASTTGRIELAGAIGPDNGLTLYAQVQDGNNYDNEGTYVLRPDGGSTSWNLLSGYNSYGGCSSNGTGQDWYDLFIAVDPNNDKRVFIGHIDVYSVTVNSSYTSMSQTNMTDVYGTSCANYGKVHPDQHAFTWVGNGAFLLGNDGGVYYNTNGTAAGFRQINNSFNTNQFYAGQIGADFAGAGMNGEQWLFGGMQDNGNASWDSGTSDFTWTARSVGGDGFFVSFDPVGGSETGGFWMTEYTYGSLYASDTGADGPYAGKNFFSGCEPSYAGSPDWSTPFLLDTLHCSSTECRNHVIGEDYVWASTAVSRGCPSWTRISGSLIKPSGGSIITMGLAPSEPKAMAVGTDDGKVWWTQTAYTGSGCTQAAANTSSFSCSANSGAVWLDADAANGQLPNRVMLQVAFDPTDHNVFYAAVGGFNANTPATPGHLFQLTHNGGAITMMDKTGNLPDVPASAVAVNPHNRKQVFVGTHFGFFYTDDIDAPVVSWVRYQDGMPNTVIQYLTIDRGPASDPIKGTTLAAFTYGRGIYLLKLPVPTGVNNAPTAAFGDSCTGLACSFSDQSTDDGTIVAWDWTFGDGGTSTAQNPGHTYGADGTYTVSLTVTDDGGLTDTATAQVTVSSTPVNNPPSAAFSSNCTGLGCSFTDQSTDDGTIVSRAWTFGDGGTSTAQNPSHTYGSAGTYTVTLVVTDDGGLTDTATAQVTVSVPSAITLSTSGYKVKGKNTVDLTWSGATTGNVDVYRNGSLLFTTANDGAQTDNTGTKGGATFTYQVCEQGSTTACSNTSTVVF